MAKRFFYACAGLLMLALSYYFGASKASAQAPSNPVVAMSSGGSIPGFIAVAANGDVYNTNNGGGRWDYVGNVFGAVAPTQVRSESWGQVKARYR